MFSLSFSRQRVEQYFISDPAYFRGMKMYLLSAQRRAHLAIHVMEHIKRRPLEKGYQSVPPSVNDEKNVIFALPVINQAVPEEGFQFIRCE